MTLNYSKESVVVIHGVVIFKPAMVFEHLCYPLNTGSNASRRLADNPDNSLVRCTLTLSLF